MSKRTYGLRKYTNKFRAMPFSVRLRLLANLARRRQARLMAIQRSRIRGGNTRKTGFYGRFQPQGSEFKFFDGTKASTTIATTGTILDDSLLHVAQGTTESQRVGRRINIVRLSMHVTFTLPSTSVVADTSDVVRFIVYIDKQANGATAAKGDLLADGDAYNSFRNLVNKGRFIFLCDKSITMKCPSGSYDGANDQFGEDRRFMKLNFNMNLPIEYSSTTGSITEIKSNNIGVMALGSQGKTTVLYKWRARFSDRG